MACTIRHEQTAWWLVYAAATVFMVTDMSRRRRRRRGGRGGVRSRGARQYQLMYERCSRGQMCDAVTILFCDTNTAGGIATVIDATGQGGTHHATIGLSHYQTHTAVGITKCRESSDTGRKHAFDRCIPITSWGGGHNQCCSGTRSRTTQQYAHLLSQLVISTQN